MVYTILTTGAIDVGRRGAVGQDVRAEAAAILAKAVAATRQPARVRLAPGAADQTPQWRPSAGHRF